jgi:hypothetical protein
MNIDIQNHNYQELPANIKLASFKEIFSIISHTISRGYVDSFGVVTGINKNNAYLVKYEIAHPVFVDYFKHTILDFDDMYTIFREPKKNIKCACDPETNRINEYAICTGTSTSMATPIVYPNPNDILETVKRYDDPHIFKETEVYDINTDVFCNAITNDYTYSVDRYIITKEAVPKPKKIISGTYSISEIVNEGDESFIYYTTKLVYEFVKMTIASKVINLD